MTQFVKHEPCLKCGSKDNLGVWNDGHKYCFGCGYLQSSSSNIHSNRFNSSTNVSNRENTMEKQSTISIPNDATNYIPSIALSWLKKFDIAQQEIIANKILWSNSRELLVFPFFGEDNILEAWQGRYFGTKNGHPKWITYGKIQDYLKIFNLPDVEKYGIILVEDIVSAIKIARQYPVSPLFGSHCDWRNLARLYKYTKQLTLWLDADKYKDAKKFSSRASLLGFDSRVIYTKQDPKELSDETIRQIYGTLITNSVITEHH